MKLVLQPATPSDEASIARISLAGFSPTLLHQAIFPIPDAEFLAWAEDDFVEKFYQNPNERFMKVVDEDLDGDNAVAYAQWTFPTGHSESEVESSAAEAPKIKGGLPTGANMAIAKEFFGGLEQRRKIHYDPKNDYLLNTLVTIPSYQGRGAGSLLIRYGLEAADKGDALAYLESSPRGYTVYAKHDFKRVEDFPFKLKENGQMVDYVTVCMRRERKSKRLD